jgi:hypothetical protein
MGNRRRENGRFSGTNAVAPVGSDHAQAAEFRLGAAPRRGNVHADVGMTAVHLRRHARCMHLAMTSASANMKHGVNIRLKWVNEGSSATYAGSRLTMSTRHRLR